MHSPPLHAGGAPDDRLGMVIPRSDLSKLTVCTSFRI